jgi:uncharacterized membrane protein YczE
MPRRAGEDGRMAWLRYLRRNIRRLVQLYVGLWLYGLAAALQVRSGLGLDPWDVFHQGLSKHVGLAIGTVVIIVGAAVLLAWIPLRQRPGLGTLSNVVLIGVSMNVSLELLAPVHVMAGRIGEMVGGIVLCGIATGMYIGAHYGPGPRDGLMTGLARRTGRSIRLVRTGIEVSVLALGFVLGGRVGVGTVLFAVSIGPLAQLFLRLFEPSVVDAEVGEHSIGGVAAVGRDHAACGVGGGAAEVQA